MVHALRPARGEARRARQELLRWSLTRARPLSTNMLFLSVLPFPDPPTRACAEGFRGITYSVVRNLVLAGSSDDRAPCDLDGHLPVNRSLEVVGPYLQFEAYRLFQLSVVLVPECGERPRVRACTQTLFVHSHPIACIRITDRPASGPDRSLLQPERASSQSSPDASHEVSRRALAISQVLARL